MTTKEEELKKQLQEKRSKREFQNQAASNIITGNLAQKKSELLNGKKYGKVLVLLSGGADSTISAMQAVKEAEEVHALTLQYGQAHHREIQSATQVSRALRLASHEIVNLMPNILSGECGLINKEVEIATYDKVEDIPTDIPKTFLPLRNQLFLTIALNRVFYKKFETVYIGVSQTDYSGYPDCRYEYIQKIEDVSLLGYLGAEELDEHIQKVPLITTPIMSLNKAQSILHAIDLAGSYEEFEKIFELTHTCYKGVEGGCGHCAACLLRDRRCV